MKKNNNRISRSEKLNGEFQKAIYDILQRKVKNPLISEMFSIVKVDTSSDLKHATVFISIYSTNADKKKTTFEAIKSVATKVRFELAHAFSHIRTVPEITFVLDDSMEYGAKMDKLFREIKTREED